MLWDTASSGSHESTSPSRISAEIDSPQSGQTVSILINLPGNSQHTASDSFPHWPYLFCSPSTLILYWLGWSEKGQMVTVLYFSSTHAGYPEGIKAWRTVSASSGPIPSAAPSSWQVGAWPVSTIWVMMAWKDLSRRLAFVVMIFPPIQRVKGVPISLLIPVLRLLIMCGQVAVLQSK